MGTYIDGLIETRTAGRARKMEADLHDFGLGKAWDARECLFGYGGVLALERPLFDQRAWPEDACDEVPKELGELNHSHSYAPWAEIAAVDWDAPLCDGPDANHLGEWRPGPGGELVLDDVVWAPAEVLGEAERLFGGDLFPRERPGGEVHLNGAVYRPVVVTPRMFVPPDGRRAPVGASMRALAAEC
ncbi:hypothetical protein [Streptomyces sp. MUM 203J]|uniref:hypothetical protein n=1 Tax=Streptomyces sp. MUM 203J TaxID=2791990 RepID=UPI001F03569A|nr:hypothetical protein [Streptomyces sp. MUM 203J]